MSAFFEELSRIGKLSSCAKLFDWLFDETRFDHFTQTDITRITTVVHKLLTKEKIKYLPMSRLQMFSYSPCSESEQVFAFQTSKSAGRDFIRHIRNGIAHGQASISIIKKESCVRIVDYYDHVEKEKLSSYIRIPLKTFISILQLSQNKGVK